MNNGHVKTGVTSEAVLLKSAPAGSKESLIQQMRDQVELASPGAHTSERVFSRACLSCRVFRDSQWFEFPDPHFHLTLGVDV